MNWDFNNDTPIYTQLVEKMKIAIVTGEFERGGKLPSVRELASQAGVNPNTVQRAMAELEREGLVCSQRTSGRLVTEEQSLIELTKHSLARRHVERFLSAMTELGIGQDEVIALLLQEKGNKIIDERT